GRIRSLPPVPRRGGDSRPRAGRAGTPGRWIGGGPGSAPAAGGSGPAEGILLGKRMRRAFLGAGLMIAAAGWVVAVGGSGRGGAGTPAAASSLAAPVVRSSGGPARP